MRYDCDDIKYMLDNADLEPEYSREFINHIESCPRCSGIVDLQPELEELLTLPSGKPTSSKFEENILAQVEKYERNLIRESRLEKLFLPVCVFLALIPLFLIVLYRGELKSFFASIDLIQAYERIRSFAATIRIPDMDIAGFIAFVSNSPLLILTLIAVSSLVWAFSIIETQKALK
jgi:Zn-finger nucleic acid-binding protein